MSGPKPRLNRLYSPPEIGAPGKRAARARRRDLLLAGAFVLAMAAVALGAFALLMPGLIGGAYRLNAFFPDADGLLAGVRVIQNGYVIGIVEGVTPRFPGRDAEAEHCPPGPGDGERLSGPLPCFHATLRIRGSWPVPVGSRAQIGAAGLLEGDAILVLPGTDPGSFADGDPTALLADGDTIVVAPRDANLMAKLDNLTESLRQMVEDTIAPALASIKAQIDAVEALLGTGDDQGANRDRLAGAFESLQRLSAELERAVDADKVGAILGSVEQMSKNLAEVSSQLSGSTQEVQSAVRNYGDLAVEIRETVRTNRPALQRSLSDTQLLLQELSSSLTPILTNIEDASRDLSALLRDVRRKPLVILQDRTEEDRTPWFK